MQNSTNSDKIQRKTELLSQLLYTNHTYTYGDYKSTPYKYRKIAVTFYK